jgi:2-methylcitrate dehydratase PrpD
MRNSASKPRHESGTASQVLAQFAVETTISSLPVQVVQAAKLHLLDCLGCGIAAFGMGASTEALEVVIEAGGAPQATLIGGSGGYPASAAAMGNATLCHALEFDDTHNESITHISAVVVPTALAVGEAVQATGAEVIEAIVLGNEAVARIGAAAAPQYMVRGFHPTSVCGVFGAAIAATKLRHGGVETIVNACGIAGSMASGIFEYLADGTDTKPLHAGWSAHAGVTAAALARYGASGPATVLEGPHGVLRNFFGAEQDQLAHELDDLGQRWETPRITFKPYPACHFVHGCLDAAASIVRMDAFVADAVDAVSVSIPAAGVGLVVAPEARKRVPSSPTDARFSLHYSVAAMLIAGDVGLRTYQSESISDPRVLALAAKVSAQGRQFPSYPSAFPGAVEVRLHDGSVLGELVEYQRGCTEQPLTEAEVRTKFRSNAVGVLGTHGASALEGAIMRLEELQHVGDALRPLRAMFAEKTTA